MPGVLARNLITSFRCRGHKRQIVKNVTIKFTVKENDSYYFATTEAAKDAFCRDNQLTVASSWGIPYPKDSDINLSEKLGRGIWCVCGSNFGGRPHLWHG